MPRPQDIALHSLFEKNNDNKMVCNLENCKDKVLYSHISNLQRHLRAFHPSIYSKYLSQKETKKGEIFLKQQKIHPHSIEQAIIELFTVNGRPLRMLDDRAFQILTKPVFDSIQITVNQHNVVDRILAFANNMKAEIRTELKEKLFSLKIDAATRLGVSLLGINAQLLKNSAIKTFTLAVKVLESSHTAAYLRSILLEVLKDYNIDVQQVLTITTDNGANMVKMVSDLNILEESSEDSDEESEQEEQKTKGKDEKQNEANRKIVQSLQSLESSFFQELVTNIRCGAHTLHLCVRDVLEVAGIKEKLDRCRRIVKKLRTPSYLSILKNGSFKKPVLDCPTRWNSSYEMLKRLLELKEVVTSFICKNAEMQLTEKDWEFVNDFVETFAPVCSATLKLQAEQLCFSEFYMVIMDTLIKLEKMPGNEMRNTFVCALNARKINIFSNDLLKAAIFLDPRIKVCLSPNEVASAKICIQKI